MGSTIGKGRVGQPAKPDHGNATALPANAAGNHGRELSGPRDETNSIDWIKYPIHGGEWDWTSKKSDGSLEPLGMRVWVAEFRCYVVCTFPFSTSRLTTNSRSTTSNVSSGL